MPRDYCRPTRDAALAFDLALPACLPSMHAASAPSAQRQIANGVAPLACVTGARDQDELIDDH